MKRNICNPRQMGNEIWRSRKENYDRNEYHKLEFNARITYPDLRETNALDWEVNRTSFLLKLYFENKEMEGEKNGVKGI